MRARLLLAFLLLAAPAYGQDLLCVDSDNDGTVETFKSAGKIDRDCDGQASLADGGTDCDDLDPRIRHGRTTYYGYTGCSAGEYRQCSNGNFGGCTSAAPTLRTNNYYVRAGGSGTACTDVAPCADFTEFQTGGSKIAADTSIWVGGNITTSFNTAGAGSSSGSPNTVKADPRYGAKITGSGSTSTFTIDQNNWLIDGLEITGGGKNIVQADNVTFDTNWIHDVTGTVYNFNTTCLDAGANSGVSFIHNILTDCYDPALTGSGSDRQNVALITAYADDPITIQYNHLAYTSAPGASPYEKNGKCIKWKHGCATATCAGGSTSSYNQMANCNVGIEVGGHANVESRGNLGMGTNIAMAIVDGGGGTYSLDGITFVNNTFDVANTRTVGGSIFFNNTPASCVPATDVVFQGNVIRDALSSYAGDRTGMITMYDGEADACYVSLVEGGGLTFENNCYSNTAVACTNTNFFRIFGGTPSGEGTNTNFAGWQALESQGFDDAGACGTQTLSSDYVPTATCTATTVGWIAEWTPSTTTTTTTSTTATTLAWTSFGFNFRDTAAYVTDTGDEIYVRGDDGGAAQDQYPTTRANPNGKSATFGYTDFNSSADFARNRDSGVAPKFAGMHFFTNAADPAYWRLNLPCTGCSIFVRAALGEHSNASAYQCLAIMDSTDDSSVGSALLTITDSDGTAAANYDDASGVNRTEAAWPAGNVAVTVTPTSHTLFARIGCATSQTGDSRLAHLSFEVSTTTTTTTTLPSAAIRQAQQKKKKKM